ncbi:MarR family transcriptional regulator [Williamsia sp. DF01-3]|uniref:MarR family transcriptional regulator n=1 Tax=Williamsia sp. DF01-3 TaxID=2934157 RepID=UPI001FF1A051|nr:MarR family transcriptional regulator [Williamsia sp. DF01-3]MCK0517346.1 MarR family transcriptional regulator [Williamsia sp. DF01-3]
MHPTSDDACKLQVLQTVRLKGRTNLEALVERLALPADVLTDTVSELQVAELITTNPAGKVRLGSEGRGHLEEMLNIERDALDPAAVDAAYGDFSVLNTEFKALITSWQMRDEDTPNDHRDDEYDAVIISRLVQFHGRAARTFDQIAERIPRLAHYRLLFEAAITNIVAGDKNWISGPLLDSYHTLWFELHEELISVSGKTRAVEAAAGHAG